jgi:hypothetical protein
VPSDLDELNATRRSPISQRAAPFQLNLPGKPVGLLGIGGSAPHAVVDRRVCIVKLNSGSSFSWLGSGGIHAE